MFVERESWKKISGKEKEYAKVVNYTYIKKKLFVFYGSFEGKLNRE
jgi:hypothetical protein